MSNLNYGGTDIKKKKEIYIQIINKCLKIINSIVAFDKSKWIYPKSYKAKLKCIWTIVADQISVGKILKKK